MYHYHPLPSIIMESRRALCSTMLSYALRAKGKRGRAHCLPKQLGQKPTLNHGEPTRTNKNYPMGTVADESISTRASWGLAFPMIWSVVGWWFVRSDRHLLTQDVRYMSNMCIFHQPWCKAASRQKTDKGWHRCDICSEHQEEIATTWPDKVNSFWRTDYGVGDVADTNQAHENHFEGPRGREGDVVVGCGGTLKTGDTIRGALALVIIALSTTYAQVLYIRHVDVYGYICTCTRASTQIVMCVHTDAHSNFTRKRRNP